MVKTMNKDIETGDLEEQKQQTIANISHSTSLPNKIIIESNINILEIREEDFKREDDEPSLYEEGVKIIDAIIETAIDSKIHGVSNIVRVESKLLKLIWLLCFISAATYCLYQIVVTVTLYLENGVIPSTVIRYEAPTNFPAVDICNLNAYDGNTASDELAKILNISNVTADAYLTVKEYIDKASAVFKSGFEELASKNKFDLYQNGFYLDQMIISCQYQGEECGISDFFYYHDYNYGSCFSFNLGKVNNASRAISQPRKILKSQKAGWENGLQIELFVGNPDKQQQYNYKGGVRVIVHNQSIIPFPDDDGIDVGTGQQTNVAISRNFIRHLSKPYSECIAAEKEKIDWNQNDVFIFMRKYFYEQFDFYFQKYCLKVCFQKYIIDKCDCFDPKFPINETNIMGCYTVDKIECVSNSSIIFYTSTLAIDCYSKCPLECEVVIYDIETTIANYPSQWYSNVLLNNPEFLNLVINNTVNVKMPAPTNETLLDSVLMINVYYNELFYGETEEEPRMPLDLLISLTGGNFSLFLGISVLSLVELLEVIFQIIYISIKKHIKHRRKMRKNKNNKK